MSMLMGICLLYQVIGHDSTISVCVIGNAWMI
ncbi:hypothetical protein THOM_0978 [Trachipleistophora hominis]|uniref:Uncharacterized protein n=1 Tax=Trachipleistophora hominis TaxID=72359 RepID=L7JX70_TRAHO|nr:hypothetical protein THOM_0978 [Trachipleistophora hominis]